MTSLDATAARLAAFGPVVDRIRERAAAIDPVRVLLTLLAVLPFVLGWSARKVFVLLWLILAHVGAAVVVGWQAGAARAGGG